MQKEENLPPPASACGVLCQFLVLPRDRVRQQHLITSDVPLDGDLHHKMYSSVLKAENEADSETYSGFWQQPERVSFFLNWYLSSTQWYPKPMLNVEY